MRKLGVILIILGLFFLSGTHVGAEDLEGRYQTIRADYRSLIIEDSLVRDQFRWARVENSLSDFILNENDDRVYKPRALYLLGRLYEQRGKVTNEDSDVKKALDAFDRVVNRYPGDDLADDALLAIARIKRSQSKFFEAKEALKKIISDYGSSDSMFHAQKNFAEIEKEDGLQLKTEAPQIIKEERLTNTEAQTLGSLEERSALVLLDPGHGGDEDGALGPAGLKEKVITLEVSLLVRDLLRETGRIRVQLTRNEDLTLPLAERTSKANDIKADLFVSIHANASEYKVSRGIETYYLDNTDDKSSLRLAQRENLVSSESPKSALAFMVSDFIQGVKMDDSISLAHLVQDSLVAKLKTEYPKTKNLGVKRAPFYVLVGAHMPCILTEVSFIDHPEEGRMLATPKYQRLVAEGIFEGIVSFLKKKQRY